MTIREGESISDLIPVVTSPTNDPATARAHGKARDAMYEAKFGGIIADRIKAGEIKVGEYIQSSNYVSGSAGWHIDGDGNAEFNNVTVRGTITGSVITGSEFKTNPGTNNNNVEIGTSQPGRVTWHDSSGGWTYMQSDGGDARIYTSGGTGALFVDSILLAKAMHGHSGSTGSVDSWLGAHGQLTGLADGSVGSHQHNTPDHTHSFSV